MATSKLFNLTTRNYIIAVGLGATAALGVSILIGQGVVRTIVTQSKVQIAKNKANTQLDSDTSAANSLVSSYITLKESQTLVAHALPTTADTPNFIAALENMANTANLKLKSISPDQNAALSLPPLNADTPAIQSVSMSLSLGGDYKSVRKFIDEVENSSRAIRVTSAEINGTDGDLSVQVSITTYYMPPATLPFKTETIN